MYTATCHCGAVSVEIPRRPRRLTSCNCSICQRYATLMAYFNFRDVKVHAKPGATASYVWGDKSIKFVRCATCGCVMFWQPLTIRADSRMGVNARNLAPSVIATTRIRRFDGASTWKFLD